MEQRGRLAFAIVVALAALLTLSRLGTPLLMDPDEARFARTTVEMVRTGDFVLPTFEGAPRTVKPPLLHWAQATFFRILGGPGELAARLPSALATLGSLALVGWVARRRFGEEGAAWAAAIFITTPMVIVEGRLGTTDALLSLHIFAALAMDMAETGETGRNRAAAIGALLGLAFLAKGPVGVVLPVLMILAGRTGAGRNVLPDRRSLLAFAAGWAVVALPWSLTFAQRISWSAVVRTLRVEVLERYFAGTDHVQPLWYFPAVVGIAFSPWVVPLALALVRVLGRRRDPAARTGLYAGAAFLAGLLFFSLGRGKLPQYVLPLAPLAALLVTWELGRELNARDERRLGPILLTATLWIESILLGAVGAVYPLPAARVVGATGAVAFGLAGLVASWGLLRPRLRLVYGAAAAAGAAFLLAVATVLHPALADYRSAGSLARAVPEMSSDRPLVLVDIRLPSLTYYLDRIPERITAVELPARLARDDRPLVVIASVDLPRMPGDVLVGLREVGREGKLRVFAEAEPPPGQGTGTTLDRPGSTTKVRAAELDGRRTPLLG